MCGITGIINPAGFEVQSLKLMTDTLRHRGPDGEGFIFLNNGTKVWKAGGKDTKVEVWEGQTPYSPDERIENVEARFNIGFGHRRLSIIDLSVSGHQPMCYANGRYWIIFNGEIYNYLEIKNELILEGYIFNSNSDTEVILAAWQKWGIDCQKRLNGMWAFVIYDCEKQEIFISRDRFGIKPFYYWFAPDGSFCFASEIKAFTTYEGWKAKLNPQRVYDYLIYSYTDHTEETMFCNVYQIPGGHYFLAKTESILPNKGRKINTSKWYELSQKKYHGTFKEASEQFKTLFKSSIKLHLRADVAVGTALSGGLDSSAIVCEMNNILKQHDAEGLQKTFSACSVDERFDEKRWMDIVINHTSVDAHFVYPKLEDVFKVTSDMIWFHDEPYQSLSVFSAYNVFQLVKSNNVKVLLNGQGADEYLGGYGQFTYVRLISKIRRFKWLGLYKEIKNCRFSKYSSAFLFRIVLASLIPERIRGVFSNIFDKQLTEIKKLINNDALGSKNINPNKFIPIKLTNISNVSRHGTLYSTLPKYLKWEDRNSMANSIEARVPFLDFRLVEFTYNLPEDYLDYQGERKRIMRDALKDILPEKIKNRRDKNGYLTAEQRWLKEDDPALFRQKIEEAIAISKGIIKPSALKYFDKVITGEIAFDYTCWRLILFAIWIEKFNIQID